MNKPLEPYDFDVDRQRRVDEDARLKQDLRSAINKLTEQNAYDKQELTSILKRALRRIDLGFYGPW